MPAPTFIGEVPWSGTPRGRTSLPTPHNRKFRFLFCSLALLCCAATVQATTATFPPRYGLLAGGTAVPVDARGAWLHGADTSVACPVGFSAQISNLEVAVDRSTHPQETVVYSFDPFSQHAIRNTIAADLTEIVDTLPVMGLPCLARDLDHDGRAELFVQSGDQLMIYSEPDWTSRGSFQFPGMNVMVFPVAVNITGDSTLEVFLTPNDLNWNAIAVVLAMDPVDSMFYVLDEIPAPFGTTGWAAASDFDGDGRIEFVAGDVYRYSIYEWQETGLTVVGQVGAVGDRMNYYASVVHPFPGGKPCVLLGYSYTNGIYRYELYEATGDNFFLLDHVFEERTASSGAHPNAGTDTDCDGLDELAMGFGYSQEIFQWNPNTGLFDWKCTLPASALEFFPVDLDINRADEWGLVNSVGHTRFQQFSDASCLNCSASGICVTPPPCGCDCFADPLCDSVRININDVIRTIEVAFRGRAPESDPSEYCPVADTDVDCDGATTVVDVVRIIDVAFRGVDPSAHFCSPCQN